MEHNPRADFINLACSASNTGSIGWFDKPQKFIDGEWVGRGEFTGVVDGKPYKIYWDDDSNPVLYIGSRTQIERMTRDLRGVLGSLGVQRSKTMRADCYLDTKRMSISDVQSNYGLAVKESRISAEITGNSEYEIVVKPSADIVLMMKKGKRRVEMMKMKPRGDYMVRAPTDKDKMSYKSMGLNEVDYCWISSKPLKLETAYEMLREADSTMLEWCKSTIRQRLDHHGIRATSVIISRPAEEVLSDYSEDLSGFDFGIEQLNEEYAEMIDELGMEEMDFLNQDSSKYDTADLISAFTEENVLVEDFIEASRPTINFSPERRNKFWDNYIQKLTDTSSKEILQNILSNSPVYERIDEFDLNGHTRLFYHLMRGVPITN